MANELFNFITTHAANIPHIDHEDFAAKTKYEEVKECWPFWVAMKNGTPTAWWNECQETAYLG
ncbi:hypothetical protein PRZ03_18485 [Paucibacter sp. hw8]|uniref:Uncharacterized protein n=2 Tax=Roseateles albus TaxID=2987525 RepID=A0ABT5KI22_9BURK|nr:hypothetical protein [Roseateles albus]